MSEVEEQIELDELMRSIARLGLGQSPVIDLRNADAPVKIDPLRESIQNYRVDPVVHYMVFRLVDWSPLRGPTYEMDYAYSIEQAIRAAEIEARSQTGSSTLMDVFVYRFDFDLTDKGHLIKGKKILEFKRIGCKWVTPWV